MKVNKIKLISAFLFIIFTLFRYYNLNNSFILNTYYPITIHQIEEIVNFDNNTCPGMMKYSDVSGKVKESKIYTYQQLIDTYKFDNNDMHEYENEKFIVIDLCFQNNNNYSVEIMLSAFEIIGEDWFEIPDMKLTRNINNNNLNLSRGINIMPYESNKASLVYVIYKDDFENKRFEKFDNEKIYIEMTLFPEKKYIKLL